MTRICKRLATLLFTGAISIALIGCGNKNKDIADMPDKDKDIVVDKGGVRYEQVKDRAFRVVTATGMDPNKYEVKVQKRWGGWEVKFDRPNGGKGGGLWEHIRVFVGKDGTVKIEPKKGLFD